MPGTRKPAGTAVDPDPSGGKVCLRCGGAIGPTPPPTRYEEAARSVAIDDIIEAAQSLDGDVRLAIKAIIEQNWRT
jgi:hypothetical protein